MLMLAWIAESLPRFLVVKVHQFKIVLHSNMALILFHATTNRDLIVSIPSTALLFVAQPHRDFVENVAM
jgi:hypothetical protein